MGSQTGHRRQTPQLEAAKHTQHDGGRPDRGSCKLAPLVPPEWAGRDTSDAAKTLGSLLLVVLLVLAS